MTGRLIVFEGLDGTGKTTQIELLSKYLQERHLPVVITRWNSSRLVSKAIKRAKKARLLTPYLYSTLHATDFLYRLENIIIPSLDEGFYVIADRYVYTALARDIARNVDRRWVEHLYALAPRPDLAFYCRTSLEESLERIAEKRGGGLPSYYEAGMDVVPLPDPREAFREFQTRVAKEYESICRQYALCDIDTTRPIDDVFSIVRKEVDAAIEIWNTVPAAGTAAEKEAGFAGDHSSPAPAPLEFEGPHPHRGKLIVFESADKIAAARQATLLANDLLTRGYDVELALAGDSWVGTEVERKALRKSILSVSTKALLSISELALMYEQIVIPTLSRGGIVVMDGYIANLVSRYTSWGLHPSWFAALYKVFSCKPDFTIFLDAPLQELMRRRSPLASKGLYTETMFSQPQRSWDESPDLSILQNVVEQYRGYARREGWYVIHHRGTAAEVHRAIRNALPEALWSGLPRAEERTALREVFQLFSRYEQSFDHARVVAGMAISVFDQTVHLHGYGDHERDILFYASMLHDIGHALSDKRHDEFTFEAIMNAAFSSIAEGDKELIANIACLHRLPYGELSMEHCARLKPDQQLLVKRMAALLRIADALDESGRHAVQAVRCYEDRGIVTVDLHAVSKVRQEREAVLRKADMFERVFHRPVVVERNGLEKRMRRTLNAQLARREQQ